MAKRPIEVKEVFQNIKESFLNEDLDFDPKQQSRFFTSNVIIRTFAHLFGKSGDDSVPVKVTPGGGLVTATSGPAIQSYETWALTFPDDVADVLAPATNGVRTDFWIWDHPVLIRISSDGTTWGSWFELSAGTFHSIDFSTHTIEIKNKTAGSNARYQVNVYY